jgi:hypothetical protein
MTASVQPEAPAAAPMGNFSRTAITSPAETVRSPGLRHKCLGAMSVATPPKGSSSGGLECGIS